MPVTVVPLPAHMHESSDFIAEWRRIDKIVGALTMMVLFIGLSCGLDIFSIETCDASMANYGGKSCIPLPYIIVELLQDSEAWEQKI